MTEGTNIPLTLAYGEHSRRWRDFLYCYPVVSRRSGGLSVGVNLNPDTACNFDCVYCQVDRTTPSRVRIVDLAELDRELNALLACAEGGALYQERPFDRIPPDQRGVCDIAFSGDGEPTTYPRFAEAVRLAAEARERWRLDAAKIVLITDACYLTRPEVVAGLRIMDENNGEIWAKLDAGTEAYYQEVNRPNYPLRHVLDNILVAARERPVVIQSLFMRLHGTAPPPIEIEAYCDRLDELFAAGARLKLIQVYTIARRTTERYATPLSDAEVDRIVATVRARVGVPVEPYYGASE